MTSTPAVWYLMRASGIVALLLLTTAFGLGVATSNRWRPPGARLYVTTQIHRNASLLAVVFLAVHIVTSVVDPDAQVGIVSALTPLGSSWSLAVGALSLDLIVALVVTSLGRRRLSYPVWRVIHWSSYAAWPLAVAHGLGMGSDARVWWSELVTVMCIGAMGGAVSWRILRPVA